MPTTNQPKSPLHLRIFLASPGDVADERARASKVIERVSYDPILRDKVKLETVAWDKHGAPMLATLTPQEAIAQGLPKPSECDIVVTIFWSRMGTPLPAQWKKPNGEPHLSGTEWELLDAMQAAEQNDKPDVLLYRRTEVPSFLPTDPQFMEKGQAWQHVEAFFDSLRNPDGSIRHSHNAYETPKQFEQELERHLRDRIGRLLGLTAETAAKSPLDLEPYLKGLIENTGHIEISGIGSGVGKVKGATRYPIERLYTPLRSRGAMEAETDPKGGPVRLAQLLPAHNRLLIEGQPGAGKTTFLRLVSCQLARDALGIPCPEGGTWRSRYLGLSEQQALPTPVLLRLADLVPMLTQAPSTRLDDHRWLLELLEQISEQNGYGIGPQGWESLLEEGHAMLLLDGLDEVADPQLRERLYKIFRAACKQWENCPLVVASRPTETAALREMGFHHATIEPFSEKEIRRFIDHWLVALYEVEDAQALNRDAEAYRQRLLEAIVGRPRIRLLATNPVMLTCLCVVHWNEGELPEGRSRVYRAVLRWLVSQRKTLREQTGFTDFFAERAFARLGLGMMGERGSKVSLFDLADGAEAIDDVVARDYPDLTTAKDWRLRGREWLQFECLGSGIIEEVSGNRLRFWHLTFQEYLAALELAWRGDGEDPEEDWWPVVQEHLDTAQWRETIDLFPGCLLDEGGVGRVDKLLGRVLALRPPKPDLAQEARIAGILGRLLAPLSVYKYRPKATIDHAYKKILGRALAIFATEGAAQVPVKDRLAAAEALGRGGDPRLAPEQEKYLEVPGLDGLKLGKYPVTVEEYQHFVEHRSYEEPKYWEGGWGFREKNEWTEPNDWERQLLTPNRPVVNVSWYEAQAYCRWLSDQRGETVRLPTAAEWEQAARPTRGEYPWGEANPDAERANFERNVGAATPVGLYPAGAGPYGHLDLAGNVWEWCADRLETPPDDEKEYGSRYVLKGGGWVNSADALAVAARNENFAFYRAVNLGFRVAVVRASL